MSPLIKEARCRQGAGNWEGAGEMPGLGELQHTGSEAQPRRVVLTSAGRG